jgi:hypothetical protein
VFLTQLREESRPDLTLHGLLLAVELHGRRGASWNINIGYTYNKSKVNLALEMDPNQLDSKTFVKGQHMSSNIHG